MVDHPGPTLRESPATEGLSASLDYLSFFAHFNAGRYFAAHEALEPRWLTSRGTPQADFLKALIQIAGAFVLVHKNRLAPARRLLARSLVLLQPYPPSTGNLDLRELRRSVSAWLGDEASGGSWPTRPRIILGGSCQTAGIPEDLSRR